MQLVALRRLLRSMFTALSEGGEPTGEELEELDRALGAALFRRRIVPEGAGHRLDPVRRDWRWVLSEVASSFTELLDAERGRVKLCENPECRWAFYDASKNRRRRWCDPAECGNVFKVREFRARRRAASAS
jgi:predicted RNA-binding Zn ribbon-like protein